MWTAFEHALGLCAWRSAGSRGCGGPYVTPSGSKLHEGIGAGFHGSLFSGAYRITGGALFPQGCLREAHACQGFYGERSRHEAASLHVGAYLEVL